MAQSGLHALIGGYAAKHWIRTTDTPAGAAQAKGLKLGFVLGALIPDVDFFVLGPMFLVDSELAGTMHRSFTHSLITTAVIVGILWLIAASRNSDWLRGFTLGFGGGILTHLAADVILWFGGIQYLWPLGYAGVPQSLNIWTWYQPPRVVSNILGALDYLAFGLYYLWLGAAARKARTNLAFLKRLRVYTVLQWTFTVIYLALSFVLGDMFDIAHYAAFILFFFPLCLYVTIKMRETIYAL